MFEAEALTKNFPVPLSELDVTPFSSVAPLNTWIVVPLPEKLVTVPEGFAGKACASFERITVIASVPVPPSFTAAIAMESKATSVVSASDSATPTLKTFGVEKKLLGTVKSNSSALLPEVPFV